MVLVPFLKSSAIYISVMLPSSMVANADWYPSGDVPNENAASNTAFVTPYTNSSTVQNIRREEGGREPAGFGGRRTTMRRTDDGSSYMASVGGLSITCYTATQTEDHTQFA